MDARAKAEMSERAESLNQTTAKITLDLPAAVCIQQALDRDEANLENRLTKATDPRTIKKLTNTLTNVRAAKRAFDPVYSLVLSEPLFTAAHEALMARALASK